MQRSLVDEINDSVDGFDVRTLSDRFADIAEAYERGEPTEISTRADVAAYAIGRGIATYTAMMRVLREISIVRGDWQPRTVLDLGAGIGSATWAAKATFPSVERATLVERSDEMIAFGSTLRPGIACDWRREDITTPPRGKWDLVIASYSLCELGQDVRAAAVRRWFEAARAELVLVDIGSPAGFDAIRGARARLIGDGATVTAPCPHDLACPMRAGDWCHFGVRVARSRIHKRVKSGERGFEDEKFSYVVASKQRAAHRDARVLRRPTRTRGLIRLRLCSSAGLLEHAASRRDIERYRTARNAAWGDALPMGS